VTRTTGGHDRAVDVTWSGVLAVAAGAALVGFAGLQVARLPKVWRGDTLLALPYANSRGPEVNHRSFPAFTGFIGLLCLGMLLVFLANALDVAALAVAGGVVVFLSLVFVPMWILVNATNRPRFLVPPTRRDEPGWWRAWRQRRERRNAGLAPTTHIVEVLDVRPPPEDRKPYEPYFMAVCTADDCGWLSDPVGRDAEHPDPEAAVREQAARHSTATSGPWRPLG
jgi:hypothetical protein